MFPNMSLLVVLLTFCVPGILCAKQDDNTCSVEDAQAAFDKALASQKGCKIGKVSEKCDSRRYYLSQPGAAAGDKEALAQCQKFGGHLAEILNEQQYDCIINFLKSVTDPMDFVYFSGLDLAHKGTFYHHRTNEPVDFFKWGRNQPNVLNIEGCILLVKSDSYLMHDWKCNDWGESYRYMCEVPA